MKPASFFIPAILFLVLAFSSCSGNPKEPGADSLAKSADSVPADRGLMGKVFRDPSELTELAGYEDAGGSVLTMPGDPDFEFGISWLRSEQNNMIVLEKFIPGAEGKTRYEILDTIMIPKLKEGQYISYCNCYRDTIFDARIIAVVNDDGKEFYNSIVKAWTADPRTKKITPLTDTKGIRCTNESYGAE